MHATIYKCDLTILYLSDVADDSRQNMNIKITVTTKIPIHPPGVALLPDQHAFLDLARYTSRCQCIKLLAEVTSRLKIDFT